MRAGVLHAPFDLRVEDRPEPLPGERDVVIEVTYNGLCGGTCPAGSACAIYEPPLPNGCTDFPRCACVPTP